MNQIKNIIYTTLARIQSYILPENNEFFDAIHLGKHDEVKTLLKTSRVNSFSKFGQTPLGYACQQLDIEMVNLLLDNGANPNIYQDSPPLLYAIETAHNGHNTSGLAKDMQAALEEEENNAFLVVKRLIDAKADAHYMDKKGSNLLMTAAYVGNSKIVQLLLDLEVDPQLKNNEDKNTFHYALMGQNKEIIKQLCEMANLEQLGEYKKQIPDGYKKSADFHQLINTLEMYQTLDRNLGVSKVIKPRKI